LDASDIIAIIRFVLFLLAIAFFAKVYTKLKFIGFVTLIIGLIFNAITLVVIETGTIIATGPRYELLLMVSGSVYLLSAILIYKAVRDFEADVPN
jgi:hypothetical protein